MTMTANAVAWSGKRTGMSGAATVTAGIVVNGGEPAVLQIKDFAGRDSARTIYRRVEGRWPRSVTVADLADTIGMRDRVIVAHRLATPLVQAFGVPRPPWLDEDGTLRSFYMLREGKRAFEEWAQHYGVPVDPSS